MRKQKPCRCIICGKLTSEVVKIHVTRTIRMKYVECEIENTRYKLCRQCYEEHKEDSINQKPVTAADLDKLLMKYAAADFD